MNGGVITNIRNVSGKDQLELSFAEILLWASFIFVFAVDKLMVEITCEFHYSMLSTDDLVFIQTRNQLKNRLELWKKVFNQIVEKLSE